MNIQVKPKQSGLTLIELMIAMVLGVIVTGALIKTFSSSDQSRHLQENVARLQENARFAIDFIIFDARMAGHWGPCGVLTQNNLNAVGSGIDRFDGTDIITAINNDNGKTAVNYTNGKADDGNANNIIDATDAIQIRSINFQTEGVRVTAAMAVKSDNLTVAANSLLASDQGRPALVVSNTCSNADLFQITNNPQGGAVGHAAGGASPGNTTAELSVNYPIDSNLYRVNFTTYSVREGANGRPSLFRRVNNDTHQELVEGVENMQIIYGVDNNNNGSVDFYVPASDVSNMNEVKSIRVTLTVATLDPVAPIDKNIAGDDGRIRRDFTSTITIRNQIIS